MTNDLELYLEQLSKERMLQVCRELKEWREYMSQPHKRPSEEGTIIRVKVPECMR